jgi:NAD(P)H-flavin reductase
MSVTPMLQALHALLGSPGDTTEVSMLYGSKVANDVLARETIDRWAEEHQDRFKVTHGTSRCTCGAYCLFTSFGCDNLITYTLWYQLCVLPLPDISSAFGRA